MWFAVSYRITDEALADIDEIQDYIEQKQQNAPGAEVVQDYLFNAFERIARNPRQCGGRARPDITSRPVKFLTVRRYVVIYDDRLDPVTIIAVAGGRRDLAQLLADDPRYPETSDE